VSVSNLALATNCLPASGCTTVQNAALTGTPRQIVVTNTGTEVAENITISFPTWPAGTDDGMNTCSGVDLAPAASCNFFITPGDTPTSACHTGIAPTPGTISISADNASAVTSNVVVLTYGCIYQGGYLFAVDDSSPDSASIGGKVLSQADQSSGIIWSSNSAGTYDGGVSIYGISEVSTNSSPDPSNGQEVGQVACNGVTDGACNTQNIYVYYQNHVVNAPINNSFYAAGICKQTISGYSDWYLPSMCEYLDDFLVCANVQNTFDNLPDLIGDPNAGTPDTSCANGANCLVGTYWQSTGSAFVPQFAALTTFFSNAGGSSTGNYAKDTLFKVRCARSVTF